MTDNMNGNRKRKNNKENEWKRKEIGMKKV